LSNKAEGTVGVITTKPWEGKVLYGFALKGEQGFYGLGTTVPTFEKGDFISFNWDDVKGRKSVVRGSVTVSKGAPAPSAPTPAHRGGYAGGDDTRNKQIAWQSCRNAAIELFPHMLAAGAIALPKTGTAKIYEATLAHINELTLRFFQDVFAADKQPTTAEEPSMDDEPEESSDD